MPRLLRNIAPDTIYHVLNRGNSRQPIFHKPQDYQAFLDILTEALRRYEVELLCWCFMPNHWHLVLRPRSRTALIDFMRWLTLTHVRRHHAHYPDETGHLYQGRYKLFPVEEDDYFLTLCRYVEANSLRAKLVKRAQDWRWSSLHQRTQRIDAPKLTDWPVDRPRTWLELVNEGLDAKLQEQLIQSIKRSRPLGSEPWVRRIATRLGLQQTLRPQGRPRKPVAQLSKRQLRRRKQVGELAETAG